MKMFDFLGIKKKTDKTKILVVDDEPNIVQTLQDRLEMNEYQVVTAGNGREGLEKIEQERPDVILLDVIMPIMDGHEMLEMLRKQPGGRDVSVIMLTARSQTQDIARANACGIDDYIVKPFDLSELLEKIESVVEHRKSVAK
jgi:DNA-binding response OmpR family regulator